MKMLKFSKIEPIIIFLFIFTQISGLSILVFFVPGLGGIVGVLKYIIFLLPIIYLMKGVYIELRMLLVIALFSTTVLINNIDPVFLAEYRLASWILLIFAVGPLFYNAYLQQLRVKLLDTLFYVFMIMGFLSFLWWIAGLPQYGRGHFGGVLAHSMLLAPVASIGSIYAITKWLSKENSYKIKLFFLLMFVSNFISILLAASRGALAATLVVLMVFIISSKIRNKKLIIFISILIGFISFQFININLANSSITQEMASRGLENTREGLWHDRIMEFNSSPIYGVGFSAQDLTLNGRMGKDASEEGVIEPGSTYLMILSMTGLVGAFGLIVLFSKYFRYIKYLKSSLSKPEVLVFVFFLIHFILEGYIFSSGSLMAFAFWLLVGATYPTVYKRIKGGNYSEN